jgi:hypothetical protein
MRLMRKATSWRRSRGEYRPGGYISAIGVLFIGVGLASVVRECSRADPHVERRGVEEPGTKKAEAQPSVHDVEVRTRSSPIAGHVFGIVAGVALLALGLVLRSMSLQAEKRKLACGHPRADETNRQAGTATDDVPPRESI